MKYFRVFETEEQYVSYVESGDFITPNISVLRDCTKIWINDSAYVPVTSVTLNTNAITIDNTCSLTATVLPSSASNKNVTWSSSNNSVATVDSNGVVSGVSCGDAVITVTTIDGGLTAQCNVIVEKHVTSVDIISALTLNSGSTYQLVETVYPNNACDKSVTWLSSDSNVVTVDSRGVVSGVASGSATVTVTTVDGGYTSQCSISITASTYTELEYIESTSGGGQYIDLDIKLYETLNNWYDIAIKYNVSGKGKDNQQPTLFGCQENNSPWPGTFIRMNTNTATTTIGRYIGGSNTGYTLGDNKTTIELPTQTAPNKNVYSLNNSNKTHSWGTSLFCAFSDANGTPFRFIAAKLYYFKLFLKESENAQGTLVRDMMPCRRNSDNSIGLLDKVNNVFYTTPSGDAFVAGPVVNS